MLFFSLFNNLSIFIVLVALYGFVHKVQLDHPRARRWSMGLLFGLAVLGCMTIRLRVAEGVIVDQRNALIVLSTLFGGPLSGLVTVAMAAGLRISLGGGGIISGITGMLLAFAAGLMLRCWPRERNVQFFLLGSLFATLVILPGFLLVGDLAHGWALLQKMVLPYGTAISLGIGFVGLLIQREENRIHSEVQLKLSERRYRQLYESIVDISFEVDNQGLIRMVSPSVESILGYRPSEVMGQSIVDYYSEPEQRSVFLEAIHKERAMENFQVLFRHKDGGNIWLSINARLLFDEQGRATGTHGIARDISKIKKAEEEKAALERSLLQSQKMEAIGTLAGGIAHDFNNILAGIMGYAEMLQLDLARSTTSRFNEYLGNILAAAERAQHLIRQILAFSRQSGVEMQPVPMRRVIEEVIVLMRASLPVTIAMETSLHAEGYVLADQVQMHQVIMNLCTNAGHAMKGQGGTLTIHLKEVVLEHDDVGSDPALEPGRYVQIRVCDTGRGIPEHLRERIFEPFFTTKGQGEGTGLGLSMVHGIVRAMKGRITVESHEGRGTCFCLTLPRTEEAADAVVHEKALPRGREHVVYVDDDPFLTEIGTGLLQELGYRVTALNDSTEALRTLLEQRERVDLIVTDLTMPKMTGLDLARRLQEEQIHIPVILCTGYSEGLTPEQLAQAGIKKCLLKPVNVSLLATAVRTVLDTHRPPAGTGAVDVPGHGAEPNRAQQ
jgi:PAS domain S-box-containing protein